MGKHIRPKWNYKGCQQEFYDPDSGETFRERYTMFYTKSFDFKKILEFFFSFNIRTTKHCFIYYDKPFILKFILLTEDDLNRECIDIINDSNLPEIARKEVDINIIPCLPDSDPPVITFDNFHIIIDGDVGNTNISGDLGTVSIPGLNLDPNKKYYIALIYYEMPNYGTGKSINDTETYWIDSMREVEITGYTINPLGEGIGDAELEINGIYAKSRTFDGLFWATVNVDQETPIINLKAWHPNYRTLEISFSVPEGINKIYENFMLPFNYGKIEGNITEYITSYPLENVAVTLNGKTVYTDSNGNYVIEDINITE